MKNNEKNASYNSNLDSYVTKNLNLVERSCLLQNKEVKAKCHGRDKKIGTNFVVAIFATTTYSNQFPIILYLEF